MLNNNKFSSLLYSYFYSLTSISRKASYSKTMSALCFILMLLIFIAIPSLLYTLFYILKCPPNTFLSSPSSPPSPRAALPLPPMGKAGFDNMELVTIIVVAISEGTENEECPVCLSAFEEGEELWKLNLCKHLFHAPCIQRWLHTRSSCPVCRAFLVSPRPPAQRKLSLAVREDDLSQGLPDSFGLV